MVVGRVNFWASVLQLLIYLGFVMYCSVLHSATAGGSVLQCAAACGSVLQGGTVREMHLDERGVVASVLQCVAVCCSVLQCGTVCSSV